MADVDYHASIESGGRGPAGGLWESLISATGARAAYSAAREADRFLSPADFLILADANANSIRSTVRQARTLARAVREHVSREVWEEVNQLYFTMDAHTRVQEAEIYDLCRTVKHGVETAIGLYDNTALHDEGREWFRCGLFIERADMTSRILDSKYHILLPSPTEVGGTLDRVQWIAVLKSASAWEAFRKVSRVDADGPRVAEMLIFNPDFPRGLLFCVRALHEAYRNAVAKTPPAHAVHADRLLTLLDLDLSALSISQVFEQGLHEFLSDFQRRLVAVHSAVTEQVFRVAPEQVA
jgi:uncharacterized alpha-E superfamily protein